MDVCHLEQNYMFWYDKKYELLFFKRTFWPWYCKAPTTLETITQCYNKYRWKGRNTNIRVVECHLVREVKKNVIFYFLFRNLWDLLRGFFFTDCVCILERYELFLKELNMFLYKLKHFCSKCHLKSGIEYVSFILVAEIILHKSHY